MVHLFDSVLFFVLFSVPPRIMVAPVGKTDIEVGKDLTLICYASGNPKPNIAWTKDGVPVKTFNASGYFLHVFDAHRKNAGSYRCTASNGYGNNVTSVSIVGIKCKYFVRTLRKRAKIKHHLYLGTGFLRLTTKFCFLIQTSLLIERFSIECRETKT